MTTATYSYRKGDSVIYTAASGGQYTAVVLTAHRTGGARIRLYFPIRDDSELLGCMQGDVFEVTDAQLSFRTRDGRSVGQLKHQVAA